MEQVKLLAIAPYHGLSEMIESVCAKRGDVAVTTLDGDLGEGLRAAREAVAADDYDMILSRGGTADLLSREMDIPTLDISISLGDILQAIKLAENYRAKFAIVGFPSIAQRARLICSLLNYDISVRTINDESEVPKLLTRLREEDYKMCIGDAVTTTGAQRCGLNSILITSSAESINTAVDQAIKLNGSLRRLRDRSRLHQLALNNAQTETLIYDENGIERFSTMKNDSAQSAVKAYITQSLSAIREKPSCRIEKVVDGTLVTIDSLTDESRGEKLWLLYIGRKPVQTAFLNGGVTVRNRSDAMSESYNRYYGFSGGADMNRAIERLSKSASPIVVLGEQGTGKDSVAAYLYSVGSYNARPLYTIDCALLNDKQFVGLLKNSDSPLNEINVTLYFKNYMLLSALRREQLLQFIEQSGLHTRCRIIVSFVTRANDAETEAAHTAVSARLGAVSLRLVPLRARRGDIPSISALYLSQLNMTLGKQLTGFEPDALKLLTQFDWPYNLDQFHRVLRELASMTSSYHIRAKDVSEVLSNERARATPSSVSGIDLNQSLDSITYDILRAVLAQENGNQKKTAERLGIGRSTIWRILKSKQG